MPPFHSVANAVGAALATVSGEIDTIEILQGKSLEGELERIKADAIAKAIANGADEKTVRVVGVDVLPVQVRNDYLFLSSWQMSESLFTHSM